MDIYGFLGVVGFVVGIGRFLIRLSFCWDAGIWDTLDIKRRAVQSFAGVAPA